MKPLYTVDFFSSGCNYEVSLNDIVIADSNSGGQVSRDIKINHWVRNGENVLQVRMESLEKYGGLMNDSKCRVKIFFEDAADNDLQKTILTDIESPPFKPLKEQSKLITNHMMTIPFEVKLNVDSPVFYNSPLVDLRHRTKDVFKCYNNIWLAHNTQGWSELLSMENKKITDIAMRYYLSEDSMKSMHLSNYKTTVEDGYNLAEFSPELLRIKLMAGGRLVTLHDTAGYPAIFYDHEDESFELYDYYLFINENDELEIIR